MKNKKAEGILGMSFGMIFSIILIVFFIVVAFIGIKAFLGFQRCSQSGLLMSDLSEEIEEAFFSEGMEANITKNVLSGIQYVCFINMSSSPINYDNQDLKIYDYIKENENIQGLNVYLYSGEKEVCGKVNSKKIKYVSFKEKNPICIKVINGKVIFNIERKFEENFVRIS